MQGRAIETREGTPYGPESIAGSNGRGSPVGKAHSPTVKRKPHEGQTRITARDRPFLRKET